MSFYNFYRVLLIGVFRFSNDSAPRWMPWDLTNLKSTLVQVMAWCRQSTSHYYLSQCWPSSMSPHGITRPQWVNISIHRLNTLNSSPCQGLTHWGRVTHICVGNLTIIGSDNGLSPGRRQAIIWTNVGILLIGPLGSNFSEMLIEIHTFSFKKIHLKMSSGKWRPFWLGLNVLRV